MEFAPIFLLNRFAFRLTDFFHHWLIDGSRKFGERFIDTLAGFDRVLALRITLHFFWFPLYGDYTVIGRILGVIFRTFRIILALLCYLFLSLVALSLYIIWLSIPFAPLLLAYLSYSS